MNSKVAVVTGASSGIGRYTAESLRDSGCTVYDFSRRNIPSDKITHIKTDVTDENEIASAVKAVYDKEGRIDILVNCAGYGISGVVEFTKSVDVKSQFDVNFFGTDNMCRTVIPFMRQNGSGRIVNISSVAAVAHIPFQTYYSATKAAIESYSFALSNEIKPFGISVTVIQPGDICTEFTQSRKKDFDGDYVYGGRISKSVSGMEKDEEKGMSSDFAGRYIAKIALKKNVMPAYAIGFAYKTVTLLCKVMPCRFRNFVIGMLYAK